MPALAHSSSSTKSCPVCGRNKPGCTWGPGRSGLTVVMCIKGDGSSFTNPNYRFLEDLRDGMGGLFIEAVDDDRYDRSEWERRRQEEQLRLQSRAEKARQRMQALKAHTPSAAAADAQYKLIKNQFGLSAVHEQSLINRGVAPELARGSLFFTLKDDRLAQGSGHYYPYPPLASGDPVSGAQDPGVLVHNSLPGVWGGRFLLKGGIFIPHLDSQGRCRGGQFRRDNVAPGQGRYGWVSSLNKSYDPERPAESCQGVLVNESATRNLRYTGPLRHGPQIFDIEEWRNTVQSSPLSASEVQQDGTSRPMLTEDVVQAARASSYVPYDDVNIFRGHLPLAHWGDFERLRSGETVSELWLTEGSLKACVSYSLLKEHYDGTNKSAHLAFIGAAGGSFVDVQRTEKGKILFSTLLNITLTDWTGLRPGVTRIIVGLDAGAIKNRQVMKKTASVVEYFSFLGFEVKIAWWGQENKVNKDLRQSHDGDPTLMDLDDLLRAREGDRIRLLDPLEIYLKCDHETRCSFDPIYAAQYTPSGGIRRGSNAVISGDLAEQVAQAQPVSQFLSDRINRPGAPIFTLTPGRQPDYLYAPGSLMESLWTQIRDTPKRVILLTAGTGQGKTHAIAHSEPKNFGSRMTRLRVAVRSVLQVDPMFVNQEWEIRHGRHGGIIAEPGPGGSTTWRRVRSGDVIGRLGEFDSHGDMVTVDESQIVTGANCSRWELFASARSKNRAAGMKEFCISCPTYRECSTGSANPKGGFSAPRAGEESSINYLNEKRRLNKHPKVIVPCNTLSAEDVDENTVLVFDEGVSLDWKSEYSFGQVDIDRSIREIRDSLDGVARNSSGEEVRNLFVESLPEEVKDHVRNYVLPIAEYFSAVVGNFVFDEQHRNGLDAHQLRRILVDFIRELVARRFGDYLPEQDPRSLLSLDVVEGLCQQDLAELSDYEVESGTHLSDLTGPLRRSMTRTEKDVLRRLKDDISFNWLHDFWSFVGDCLDPAVPGVSRPQLARPQLALANDRQVRVSGLNHRFISACKKAGKVIIMDASLQPEVVESLFGEPVLWMRNGEHLDPASDPILEELAIPSDYDCPERQVWLRSLDALERSLSSIPSARLYTPEERDNPPPLRETLAWSHSAETMPIIRPEIDCADILEGNTDLRAAYWRLSSDLVNSGYRITVSQAREIYEKALTRYRREWRIRSLAPAPLEITQIIDLGLMGAHRGSRQQTKSRAMISAIKEMHELCGSKVGILESKAHQIDGDGRFFVHHRGSNLFQDCDVLIVNGLIAPNAEAVAAEYALIFGESPSRETVTRWRAVMSDGDSPPRTVKVRESVDERFSQFYRQKILAEIHQAVGRLRADRRGLECAQTGKTLQVYLVTNYPMDFPVRSVRADSHFAGDPHSYGYVRDKVLRCWLADRRQALRRRSSFLDYTLLTQEEIAEAAGCSQGYVSKVLRHAREAREMYGVYWHDAWGLIPDDMMSLINVDESYSAGLDAWLHRDLLGTEFDLSLEPEDPMMDPDPEFDRGSDPDLESPPGHEPGFVDPESADPEPARSGPGSPRPAYTPPGDSPGDGPGDSKRSYDHLPWDHPDRPENRDRVSCHDRADRQHSTGS